MQNLPHMVDDDRDRVLIFPMGRLRHVVGDSLPVPGDPLRVVGDSLPALGDSLHVVGDSLAVLGDPLRVVGDKLVCCLKKALN